MELPGHTARPPSASSRPLHRRRCARRRSDRDARRRRAQPSGERRLRQLARRVEQLERSAPPAGEGRRRPWLCPGDLERGVEKLCGVHIAPSRLATSLGNDVRCHGRPAKPVEARTTGVSDPARVDSRRRPCRGELELQALLCTVAALRTRLARRPSAGRPARGRSRGRGSAPWRFVRRRRRRPRRLRPKDESRSVTQDEPAEAGPLTLLHPTEVGLALP